MVRIFAILVIALAMVSPAAAQTDKTGSIEREIRAFYEAYGQDLGSSRGAAIIERYDPRGAYALGNGVKTFQTPEFLKQKYTAFKAPKHFAWKDITVDVLTPDTVAVLGLFEWQTSGPVHTYSYTGILVKRGGKWRIRVEDESRPVSTTQP